MVPSLHKSDDPPVCRDDVAINPPEYINMLWLSGPNCMVIFSELFDFYGLDWKVHLIGGEVNLDVWGGCMESTDENSGHEIHISVSSVKMGPSGCERATWNQLMWPKRSRLSDWAPLFIWGLIALLSTSRRCAVGAQVIALCKAKLVAWERSQRSWSLAQEWPRQKSRLENKKIKNKSFVYAILRV